MINHKITHQYKYNYTTIKQQLIVTAVNHVERVVQPVQRDSLPGFSLGLGPVFKECSS